MDIEIFADLTCPWCYIGRARVARAIRDWAPTDPVNVIWQPFQLNPDLPAQGMARTSYLALKFGSRRRAEEVVAAATTAAHADGLPFNPENMTVMPNTLDAHRLVLFAAEHGRREAALDALFTAFFRDGADLGAWAVLSDTCLALGLDPDELAARLEAETDYDALSRSEQRARSLQMRGVPAFIIAGQYMLSGAQDPKSFMPLFDLVRHAQLAAPSRA